MKKTMLLSLMMCLALTACTLPGNVPPSPTALIIATIQFTSIPFQTFTPISAQTQTPVLTQTPLATAVPSFCNDPRGRDLITSLTTAIQSKDGSLLASLVSPSHGMDVRFYRDGKVINYDVEHTKFIFETSYQADWGLSFGSGQPTSGSFQEIVLPSLKQVFTSNAKIVCDQLKTGGVTYEPIWPYPTMDFYSVHFAGTDPNGGLDWQTWAAGIDNVAGKLYIAALAHYVWEP